VSNARPKRRKAKKNHYLRKRRRKRKLARTKMQRTPLKLKGVQGILAAATVKKKKSQKNLQLEREGAPVLDDPQGPLKKRKEEILPLTAHPVRKKEDPKRKGLAQAPPAVTPRMQRLRRPAPRRTESGASLGHKTKDLRSHPRNDQRKNPALRILQVIRINCRYILLSSYFRLR